MNLFFSPLIINEVFPNPGAGSEWVELFYLGENQPISSDYIDFTISDDKRVIYHFQGDEVWSNNLLVIELAGLNNDKDSVILKNAEEIIIDEMSYTTTKKDLSWLRIDPDQSVFVLGQASPLQLNSTPIPSTEPTTSPKPSTSPKPTANPSVYQSLTPTISPSISPSTKPSLNPTINPPLTSTADPNKQNSNSPTDKSNINELLSPQDLSQKFFINYQNYQNLQINYEKDRQFKDSRQVFLGQKILKKELIDAIMGSSLLIIAAILLSYESRTKN